MTTKKKAALEMAIKRGQLEYLELNLLIEDVKKYIDNIYMEIYQFAKTNMNQDNLEERTRQFFRSKERVDNIIIILQYLISFTTSNLFLDLEDQFGKESFRQFLEAIQYLFKQLQEDDVHQAILRDFLQFKSETSNSPEQVEKQAHEKFDQLNQYLLNMNQPSLNSLLLMFRGLLEYTHFWFDLKNYNHKKIRRSDFFIYKFSRHLLKQAFQALQEEEKHKQQTLQDSVQLKFPSEVLEATEEPDPDEENTRNFPKRKK